MKNRVTETLVAEELRWVNWNQNLRYLVCNDEIVMMGITKEFFPGYDAFDFKISSYHGKI